MAKRKPKMVTRESLEQMLKDTNPIKVMHVVGRALVVLYKRQTESERAMHATVEHNGRGFTGCDADIGTSHAEFYIKNEFLTTKQIAVWLKPRGKQKFPRLCSYHKQLNEAAVAKAQTQLEV